MQKLWTICLSLMMGISFVLPIQRMRCKHPSMETSAESLETCAKAPQGPLDQLADSFPC